MTPFKRVGAEEQLESLAQLSRSRLDTAKALHVELAFARDFGVEAPDLDERAGDLVFASYGLETVGVDLLRRAWPSRKMPNRIWRELLEPAYRLKRPFWRAWQVDLTRIVEVAIDGVLSNRQPELRLLLRDTPLDAVDAETWDQQLHREVCRCFLLLVRKADGLRDVLEVLRAIDALRDAQAVLEAKQLELATDRFAVASQAGRLVALYNLARIVELTAQFLTGGAEHGRLTAQGIQDDIDRFVLNARDAQAGVRSPLKRFVLRLGEACKALIRASVFAVTAPAPVRRLLAALASPEAEGPTLELWYAQRDALDKRLLDPTRSAIVVSMPTSSGKTLLAEMVMAQALADAPEARVAYLAPTRALVTQVSLKLRRDLGGQGFKVRVATPAFELDPVEDELLQEDFSVLVTTPEKLDLLMRTGHSSIQELSLVVVDEAHNLGDSDRGAKLELLLAMLRRERPQLRFLLLSPFARNANALAQWLAGDSGAPIVVDWKPNDRVVGTVTPGAKVRNVDQRPLYFTSLNSVHSDCPENRFLRAGNVTAGTKTKNALAVEAAAKWAEVRAGGVLLLAASRPKAEDRAERVAGLLGDQDLAEATNVVCRFLEAESGGEHPLTPLLKRGVAFHHAGLSTEARYFVERLVEGGAVRVVCATTTLAQGVNFPLAVAVIESFHRARPRRGRFFTEAMKPSEFWNIAGRVGRTLTDPLGVVAFAAPHKRDREKIQEFVDQDSSIVTSALFEFLRTVRDWDEVYFSRDLIQNVPTASAFLQYLVHALAVSDLETVQADLEGLLRSSFVYQQARQENQELADALIRLARQYIEELAERKGKALSGFAKMADGTGFSSPSIDLMWSEWREQVDTEPRLEDWSREAVFPEDGSASEVLTKIVETLHEIPEVRLGSEDEGEFSAPRIARITAAWVNGATLGELAAREYGGDLLRCTHHIFGRIVNLVPWGMRGIQRVAFAGQDDSVWDDLDLLPAMVFHGVRSKEAIAFRMLNVPRLVAEGLAEQWRGTEPNVLSEASAWLEATTEDAWAKALPEGGPLSGAECRTMWEIVDGQRTWREAFGP